MMRKMGQRKKNLIKIYVNRRIRKRHLKHILCLLVPILLALSTVFLISFAGIEVSQEGELLLFKTDAPTLEEDLNAGIVSEELKIIFEKEGFPLSDNAALINSSDTEHVLTNEEKNVISTESIEIAENRSYQLSENGTLNNKTTNEYIIKKEEKDVFAEESKKIVTIKSPLQSENFTSTIKTNGRLIENAGKVYTIKKVDGELKIYGKMITLRYMAAAILILFIVVFSLKFISIPVNYIFTEDEAKKRDFSDKLKESIFIGVCADALLLLLELSVIVILYAWYEYTILFQF